MCQRLCFKTYWEKVYPRSSGKADQHLPIKKNPVKFEFHYNFGIASPVTLVQKGLLYFKEENNKKQKNPINTN